MYKSMSIMRMCLLSIFQSTTTDPRVTFLSSLPSYMSQYRSYRREEIDVRFILDEYINEAVFAFSNLDNFFDQSRI